MSKSLGDAPAVSDAPETPSPATEPKPTPPLAETRQHSPRRELRSPQVARATLAAAVASQVNRQRQRSRVAEPPKGEPPAAPEPPRAPAAAPASALPPPTPGLPAEFLTPAHERLYAEDPGLRSRALGIWRQGDKSTTARALELERLMKDAEAGRTADPIRQRAELARQGRLDELARGALAEDQARRDMHVYVSGATRTLANALDVDPDDPEFQAAGGEEGTPEEQVERFADYVVRRSPRAQRVLDGLRASMAAEVGPSHQAEIERLKVAQENELEVLRKEWQERLDAGIEEARSSHRAGVSRVPRVGITLPPHAESGPVRPSNGTARGNLYRGMLAQLNKRD